MPDHNCEYEERWGRVLNKMENMCRHIDEGEREGGFRDILRDTVNDVTYLREQISEIKKGQWRVAIITGIVTGMIVRSPDIVHVLLPLISKIAFAWQ